MKYLLLIALTLFIYGVQAQDSKPKKQKKPSLYKAENYLLTERYQKAKEEIDRYIASPDKKKKANVWFLKARIYLSIMLSDEEFIRNLSPRAGVEAADAYRKVLESQRNDKTPLALESKNAIEQIWGNYIKRGADSYEVKNYEEAYKEFNHAVLVKPTDSIALSYAAYMAQNIEKYDEAIGYLNTIIELNKQNQDTYNSLIIIYKTQNKDTTQFLKLLDQAIERYPEEISYVKEKILLLSSIGKEKKANNLLREVLIRFPDDLLLLINTAVYFDQQAVNQIKEADYDQADLYLDTAAVHYERALAVDNARFEVNYNLGVLQINRSKRYYNPLAMMDYKEYNIKGKSYEEKGSALITLALPYLEKAYDQAPEDYDVLLALNQVYTLLKRTKDAERINTLIEQHEKSTE